MERKEAFAYPTSWTDPVNGKTLSYSILACYRFENGQKPDLVSLSMFGFDGDLSRFEAAKERLLVEDWSLTKGRPPESYPTLTVMR